MPFWKKILFPVLALIALSGLVFLWWHKSTVHKRIAKLKTEIERNAVIALRAKQEASLEKNLEIVGAKLAQMKSVQRVIQVKRADLAIEEERLEKLEENIKSLNSWSGLDAFNKRDR